MDLMRAWRLLCPREEGFGGGDDDDGADMVQPLLRRAFDGDFLLLIMTPSAIGVVVASWR